MANKGGRARNEAFIGPSEFFHDCVPGDKSTAPAASLFPQIQLFGKLNLSKSRRASWCSRRLPLLPPLAMKGRNPLGWLSRILLYRLFISYWQPRHCHVYVYVYVHTCVARPHMHVCMYIYWNWVQNPLRERPRIYFSPWQRNGGGGVKRYKLPRFVLLSEGITVQRDAWS